MLNSIQSTIPSPLNFLPERGSAAADGRFGRALAKAQAEAQAPAETEARKVAEEFVGITLVQPILTMLREHSDAAPPFAPGPGEQAFGPLLDAEIAQRITRAKGFGLVDVVARSLLKRTAAAESQEVLRDVR